MGVPDGAAQQQSQPHAMDGKLPLAGRHIVVTRPAEQAGHLAEAIRSAGATPVLFPVLAIYDIDDRQPLLDIAARLEAFDLAVFVSPNAVSKTLGIIGGQRRWPAHLRAAAMGLTSERELARFGVTEIIAPRLRFDSEALLELPELQEMAGKRVVVFRGDSGRDLLGDTLSERGATVEYVTCYRRGKPDLDTGPLLRLWAGRQLDAVLVTSSEGLRNLAEMLGEAGREMLKGTPLFAPHARIAAAARQLGLRRVVPTAAGDEGLMAGLIKYFSSPDDGRHPAEAAQGAHSHADPHAYPDHGS
ncbi:MAG: uroporphyrinogen-III synthase [Sterolibacterium sp.]|jgi:uroporphyrinogen-III synthase